MRIITGTAKGRKIKAPEGMETRPTSDRVKESIFNIIQDNIYGSKVLDLFAGTGNLGLECISRGSENCTFVEKSSTTFSILIENVKYLNFQGKCMCMSKDAFFALDSFKNIKKFDLIFLDPPYGKSLIEKSIMKINELDLLEDGGIIISEYDINDMIPENIEAIQIYRTEKYGRTKVSFWQKEDING